MIKEEEQEPIDDSTEEQVEEDAPTDTKTSGAKIPESFQNDVDSLIASCSNDHMLDYIQSCLSKKRSEMMDEKTSTVDKKGVPAEYSTEDMPKD